MTEGVASTCLALITLRRTAPGGAAIPIPGGPALAVIALGFCALLAARMGRAELLFILAITGLGLLHRLIARRAAPSPGAAQ